MPNLSRKEELERKKAKLAAMREERLQREAARQSGEAFTDIPAIPKPSEVDADGILGDLGIGPDGKLIARLKTSDITKSSSSPSFLAK